MYLERHHKAVEGYLGKDLEEMKEKNPSGWKIVEPYVIERDTHIHWLDLSEEVGYWRKANAIHRWFVENVQNGVDDCGRYNVSKEQLEELLENCKEVIKNHLNEEDDYSILPTEDGFFFGSTEYDEWYYEDISSTIKILEKVLAETDFENYQITYQSSW